MSSSTTWGSIPEDSRDEFVGVMADALLSSSHLGLEHMSESLKTVGAMLDSKLSIAVLMELVYLHLHLGMRAAHSELGDSELADFLDRFAGAVMARVATNLNVPENGKPMPRRLSEVMAICADRGPQIQRTFVRGFTHDHMLADQVYTACREVTSAFGRGQSETVMGKFVVRVCEAANLTRSGCPFTSIPWQMSMGIYVAVSPDCFTWESSLHRALKTFPWFNKGNSLDAMGSPEEAIVCYDRALEIDPRFAAAWYNKGNSLGAMGRPEEAILCYDRALEINPRLALAWHNKGYSLSRLDRNEEAIPCYDRALEIDPRFAAAWNDEGNSLSRLGRDKEAILCYDRALENDPRLAAAWLNKGNSLISLDRNEEAVRCFGRALEIDSRLALAWFFRALAEEGLGRKQDAVGSYRQFLVLGSAQFARQAEHARQRLQDLEDK